MPNYKIEIAYDGTHYCGWQIQPNGLTIQQLLQDTFKIVLKNPISIIGSGRTDAGVHAHAQIANFTFDSAIDQYRFLGSVNALLPKDVRVKSIVEVSPDFHAQYSATGKIYRYRICLNQIQSPFERLYQLHVKEKIDLDLLKETTKLFLGTHDFHSFANEAHRGTASHDSIRTMKRLDMIEEKEGEFSLIFEADGFLYKMVRNIVGTLLDISRGKLNQNLVLKLFSIKDRRLAGKAAPPHGLFLVEVLYP